jgi:hypothetical protein
LKAVAVAVAVAVDFVNLLAFSAAVTLFGIVKHTWVFRKQHLL